MSLNLFHATRNNGAIALSRALCQFEGKDTVFIKTSHQGRCFFGILKQSLFEGTVIFPSLRIFCFFCYDFPTQGYACVFSEPL